MKKVISWVAALALLLMTMAFPASAAGLEGDGTESSPYLITGDAENLSALGSLFAGEAPQETIYLKVANSFTLAANLSIPEGFDVNLDLAGQTITGSNDEQVKGDYLMTNYGTLTLRDSVGGGKATASVLLLENMGTLTVKNGTYETTERGVVRPGNAFGTNSCVFRNTGGEVEIEDCTVNAMAFALYSGVNSQTGAEPKVTILNGTFTSKACSTCDKTYWGYCVSSTAGEIYVENATVTGTQGALSIVGGYGEVKGGNYKTQDCEKGHGAIFYALYVAGEVGNAKAVISGGTFESEKRNAALVGNSADGGKKLPATVLFTGGNFISPEGVSAINAAEGLGTPSIIGGTYSSDVSAYVSTAATYDPDTGVVTPIAQEGAIASIEKMDGITYYYDSLGDAVADVKDAETILLLQDTTEPGIVVPSGSNFTIDFGGHTYRITNPVGSSGTVSNGMQLLKDSNLTFKNGTIARSGIGIQILIQNYSNLTLEDLTLDGTTGNSAFLCAYVLSNNHGNTVLKGNTNILARGSNVAFDVCYWPNSTYADGVSVTVDESMTGVVDGAVEISAYSSTAEDLKDLLKLNIRGGNFEGAFQTLNLTEENNPNVSITAGSFTADISQYVEDGYTMVKNSDGTNMVLEGNAETAITDEINVLFQPGATANTYDLMLTSAEGKYINRLSSAELKFALTLTDGNVTYTLTPAENVNITELGDGIYGFNYDGENASDATGQSIRLASVTFTGYGTGSFASVSYDGAKVNTAKVSDNIVSTYIPGGDGTVNGVLVLDEAQVQLDLQPVSADLTVEIAFNNNVAEGKAADYMKMNVNIVGADGSEVNIPVEAGNYSADKATVVAEDLTANLKYTITVTGDGYRTARKTVLVAEGENAPVLFWNNVKDDTTQEYKNFLAGDIVMDNVINIYDLSAVVSYFGSVDIKENSEYIRYDLNRDGTIDSKDVAMVLVSWEE